MVLINAGGYSNGTNAKAAGNKVYLSGGTFIAGTESTVNIYGGYAEESINSCATNNETYVYGNVDLSNVALYGGVATGSGTPTISDNTLIFGYKESSAFAYTPWAPDSYTIGSVKNFSTIRFDAAVWDKTITVNEFSNTSTDSTVTRVDATKVAFSVVDSLAKNDSYAMLKVIKFNSGSLALTSAKISESSTYTLGTTLQGSGTVSLSDSDDDNEYDTVTYTIGSIGPSGENSSDSG